MKFLFYANFCFANKSHKWQHHSLSALGSQLDKGKCLYPVSTSFVKKLWMTFSFFSFIYYLKNQPKRSNSPNFLLKYLGNLERNSVFFFFSLFREKSVRFFFLCFFWKIGPKRSNCKHAGNKGNLISLWNYVESRISLSFWAYLEQPSRNWSEFAESLQNCWGKFRKHWFLSNFW